MDVFTDTGDYMQPLLNVRPDLYPDRTAPPYRIGYGELIGLSLQQVQHEPGQDRYEVDGSGPNFYLDLKPDDLLKAIRIEAGYHLDRADAGVMESQSGFLAFASNGAASRRIDRLCGKIYADKDAIYCDVDIYVGELSTPLSEREHDGMAPGRRPAPRANGSDYFLQIIMPFFATEQIYVKKIFGGELDIPAEIAKAYKARFGTQLPTAMSPELETTLKAMTRS